MRSKLFEYAQSLVNLNFYPEKREVLILTNMEVNFDVF